MPQQTWFVTGSTRGFGHALVSAALDAGHQVVATARWPERLADLVARHGERVLPVALDVTDGPGAAAALAAGVERFGKLDIVVNNAGYANIAPVETAPEEDFRRQFETNFWGVYHVSKAAVPVLRAQGGGTVVQFSSIGGRVGTSPGLGSYQSAKFAVDGLTRALAAETAPLGIRWLVVEPSGFATDWAGASMQIQEIPAGYDATVGAMARVMGTAPTQAGDPARAAEILLRVVGREHLPTHLLVGAGAAAGALAYSGLQVAEASAWQAVSESADFGRPYPVDLPADEPTAQEALR